MVMFINNNLLFIKFVDPEDAKWVFEDGKGSSRGNPMQLEWWNPDFGCVKRKDTMKEV